MNSRGRPTKYSAQMLSGAEKYIRDCSCNCEIPFIEELAFQLGIDDDTLVEWTRKHNEFSAAIKRLKMLQRLRLQKDSLSRKVHPTSAIFLLKANHGFIEEGKRYGKPDEPSISELIMQAENGGEYAPWSEAKNN
jgi:hypothetical protein